MRPRSLSPGTRGDRDPSVCPSRRCHAQRPRFGSRPTVLSAGSLLSVARAASIMSVGSFASILSIGSAGSILSICSAGSILCIGEVRHGAPAAAILLPVAFFLSVLSPAATQPKGLIYLAFVAAAILAADLVVLGVGLLKASGTSAQHDA